MKNWFLCRLIRPAIILGIFSVAFGCASTRTEHEVFMGEGFQASLPKPGTRVVVWGNHEGAVTRTLGWLEDHQILGFVLVGAYHTDLGMETEKKSGYFDRPWRWEQQQKNQKWVTLFASEDDPWIPIEEPRYIHEKLQCDYHEYKDQGHFGGDYFKSDFPELTRAILSSIG